VKYLAIRYRAYIGDHIDAIAFKLSNKDLKGLSAFLTLNGSKMAFVQKSRLLYKRKLQWQYFNSIHPLATLAGIKKQLKKPLKNY